MSHVEIALIVFVCVFGSALLGLYVRTILPEHHLSDESTGVLKLAVGLIATMAAIVLGLLISSAKNSFDTVNGEVPPRHGLLCKHAAVLHGQCG